MTTPMMQQWRTCKDKAGDALLLFRLGDFYEAFYDDAITISKEADLTLTKRQTVPMAGIPYHAAATYIDRLIAKGYKVAIAEQLEEAGKGLVRREIVRTITPGSQIQGSLLEESKSNFIACLVPGAVAFLDLTTAHFMVAETESAEEMGALLCKYQPAEILYPKKQENTELLALCKQNFKGVFSPHDSWLFDQSAAELRLKEHFKVLSLDGLGFKNRPHAARAAGSLMFYLADYLNVPLSHIHKIAHYNSSEYLFIDRTTQRNLELIEALHDASRQHTLLHILDKTETPMGSRLMKVWIVQPLARLEAIVERQEAITELRKETLKLAAIRDLERLTMRIATAFSSPRDLIALKNSLAALPPLKHALSHVSEKLLRRHDDAIADFSPVTTAIETALLEECPLKIGDGPLFIPGYCPELDALYAISGGCKTWLIDYQTALRQETGIKSLKVSYTQAFGYFIDVSLTHSGKVPGHFQKRQTLVSSERFITEELKTFEQKVLSAEEQIHKLEALLLDKLRQTVAISADALFKAAHAIAELDCLNSLALVSRRHNYCCPHISDSYTLTIVEGRHPVIEQTLTSGPFTPNNVSLEQERQLMVLTGPNMGGKSTYIRQVALIALMAHMGSFVPATRAVIPLIDKIFTRIGASDDLSRGQSTFMVEMTETANILNMATNRSLVILDEIGRGTSTFDGIAIAWSVAEYLLQEKRAKTLFATHYFELTRLETKNRAAFNAHVAVQESCGSLLFLHRIVSGPASRSFGIQVAELAGLPARVISRAKEIQNQLENPQTKPKPVKPAAFQTELPLFV